MIGAYQITFPGAEFYIGSASGMRGFKGRWDDHKNDRNNSPKYLQETAQKYGGWSYAEFIILREAKNKHRALLWEQAFINKNKENPLLLNKRRFIFGPPDMTGKHHSEETKKKMSEAAKGKPKSEKTKKKLSEANKGKHLSEEHKKKISETCKGEKHPLWGKHHSEESKKKISEAMKVKYIGEGNPFFGKRHSEETKKKISEANKGKHYSEETKEKLRTQEKV